MSTPKDPDPAKLVISLFMKDKIILDKVFSLLEKVYGPVDIISKWLELDYTDYYYKEMGSPLFRKVLAFKRLIQQDELSSIKEKTNSIELKYSNNERRSINIDPGYLLSSRFILATGKDYSHRVYIGRKIYADLTLMYTKQGFKVLEWTYPDYASEGMTQFLLKIRDKYLLDLKEIKRKNK
jgi:hypothetical protein